VRHAASSLLEARRIRRASLLFLVSVASVGSAQAARDMAHLTVSASVPTACEVRVEAPAMAPDGDFGTRAPVEMRCTREAIAAITMSSSEEGPRSGWSAEPSWAMVYMASGIHSGACEFIVLGRGLEAPARLLGRSCLRIHAPATARFVRVTADFHF